MARGEASGLPKLECLKPLQRRDGEELLKSVERADARRPAGIDPEVAQGRKPADEAEDPIVTPGTEGARHTQSLHFVVHPPAHKRAALPAHLCQPAQRDEDCLLLVDELLLLHQS